MRAFRRATAAACALVVLAGSGCANRTAPAGEIPAWGHESVRFLGPADELGEGGLLDAMGRRSSVRDRSGEPISDRQFAALLWSAQGVSAPSGARTVPSAGALYPLETYVLTPQQVLRYIPRTASVEVRTDAQAKAAVAQAISGTPASRAYAIVVITGVPGRITGKYDERGIRYMWMEAGHAAQNLLLAAAMGLGRVTIGAFDDAGAASALTLSEREIPLYLIPDGLPG